MTDKDTTPPNTACGCKTPMQRPPTMEEEQMAKKTTFLPPPPRMSEEDIQAQCCGTAALPKNRRADLEFPWSSAQAHTSGYVQSQAPGAPPDMRKIVLFLGVGLGILVIACGLILSMLWSALSNRAPTVAATVAQPPPQEQFVLTLADGAALSIGLRDGKITKTGRVDDSAASRKFWEAVSLAYPEMQKKIGVQYLIFCGLKDNPQIVERIGQEYVQAFIKRQQDAARAAAVPPPPPAPAPPATLPKVNIIQK